MSAAERSRELAADLARRAIAAAERRQAENGPSADELTERLRDAAGEDGRLSVTDAVEAVTGSRSSEPINWLAAEYQAHRAKQKPHARERLFGRESEPAEPPSNKPQGDADAGKGEPDNAVYERTSHGRMRVFDLDNLMNEGSTDD